MPFLETALKKVIRRKPVKDIFQEVGNFGPFMFLSPYRLNKFQHCFSLQNIPHSTTPHRHIALLGMIAALSRDFSLPPISITRVVSGQSWHFQGSFN